MTWQLPKAEESKVRLKKKKKKQRIRWEVKWGLEIVFKSISCEQFMMQWLPLKLRKTVRIRREVEHIDSVSGDVDDE